MPISELLILLLFISAVGTVFAYAGIVILRFVVRRLVKRPASARSSALRWIDRTVLVLAAIGIVCIAYAHFVEPFWLEVTHVRLTSPKLPAGARPIRIVHISDFHCDPTVRLEERLPGIIAQQKPDVIVFTGDAVNSTDALPVFRRCITKIAAIAPTFGVTGNWDLWSPQGDEIFDGTGVRQLRSEAVKVNVAGAELWIAGVQYGRLDRLPEALSGIPDGALTVFLYHSPSGTLDIAAHDVDLLCMGHTHGGQVALPFYGALITLSKHGKRFEAGLYRESGTWIYVNRGIGMEGGHVPRVRFLARPEVTVIEIAPGREADAE